MLYVIKGGTLHAYHVPWWWFKFVIEGYDPSISIPVYQINNASYPNAIVYFERLLPWVLDTSVLLSLYQLK